MDVVVGGFRYRGKVSPVGTRGSAVVEFYRLVDCSGVLSTSTRYPTLVGRRVGSSESFVWAAPSRKFAAAPSVGSLVVAA